MSDVIDDEDIVLLEMDHSFEYYLRVKIWAQQKRRSANRVRGLLFMVTRPEQAGDTSTRKASDGAFKWAGHVWAEHVDIAPGTWRRLDILRYTCMRDSGEAILAPALNRPTTTTDWPPSIRNRLTDAGVYS